MPLSFASSVVFLRSKHDRVALSPRVLQHSCGNARPILDTILGHRSIREVIDFLMSIFGTVRFGRVRDPFDL